jgi:hypothetical protein
MLLGGAQGPGSAPRRRLAEIAGLVFSSLFMSSYHPPPESSPSSTYSRSWRRPALNASRGTTASTTLVTVLRLALVRGVFRTEGHAWARWCVSLALV